MKMLSMLVFSYIIILLTGCASTYYNPNLKKTASPVYDTCCGAYFGETIDVYDPTRFYHLPAKYYKDH